MTLEELAAWSRSRHVRVALAIAAATALVFGLGLTAERAQGGPPPAPPPERRGDFECELEAATGPFDGWCLPELSSWRCSDGAFILIERVSLPDGACIATTLALPPGHPRIPARPFDLELEASPR